LLSYLSQNLTVQKSPERFQQEFQQLGQDLQSGNLSAAQSDLATMQQDFQARAVQHHHHHAGSTDSSASAISQLLNELGSALKSGNLSSAQQEYSSLQQDLAQFAGAGAASRERMPPVAFRFARSVVVPTKKEPSRALLAMTSRCARRATLGLTFLLRPDPEIDVPGGYQPTG